MNILDNGLSCIGTIKYKSKPNSMIAIELLEFDDQSKRKLLDMVNNGITRNNQELFAWSIVISKQDYKLFVPNKVYSGEFETLLKINNVVWAYKLIIDAFTLNANSNNLSTSDNSVILSNVNMMILATKPIIFEEIND